MTLGKTTSYIRSSCMHLLGSLKLLLTPLHARKYRRSISSLITISGAGLRLDLEEQQQTPGHVVGGQRCCVLVPASTRLRE